MSELTSHIHLTNECKSLIKELHVRLDDIKARIDELLTDGWQFERVQSLSRLVNGLTETLTVTGLPAVAIIATELQTNVQRLLACNSSPGKKEIRNLERLFGELLPRMQPVSYAHVLQQLETIQRRSHNHANSTAFIAAEASSQTELWAQALKEGGYQTRLFTDAHALILTLQDEPAELPAIIVLDLSSAGVDSDSRSEQLMAIARQLRIPVVCLGENRDVQAYLYALRAGATRYMEKPVESAGLLNMLEELVDGVPRHPLRALLVNEDSLVLRAHAAVLAAAGLDVNTLTEPLQVFAAVDDWQPDIVVIDGDMQEMTALELAGILHSRNGFSKKAILRLSSGAVAGKETVTLNPAWGIELAKPVQANTLLDLIDELARSMRRDHDTTELLQQVISERERIYEALDEHALVSITDRHGNITYANRKFCDVSGYSHDELIGQNHRIIKSGQHRPEFYKQLWRTIARGNIWKGIICNQRKDGSLYWVVSTIVPYMDKKSGKPYRYTSIRTDITELKSIEKQLQLRNVAIEAAANGIVIIEAQDPEMPVIYANSAFEAITGYPMSEILGNSLRLLLSDNSSQTNLDDLYRVMGEENSINYVLRSNRKDGGQFWGELSIARVHNEHGALSHYIGILKDITSRVRAEQELLESRQNLLATLQSSRDGILAVDDERRIIFMSEQYIRIANVPEKLLNNGTEHTRILEQVVDRVKDPEQFLQRIEEIYSKLNEVSFDIVEFTDGRILERESMPLIRENKPSGRVWSLKDITDIVHAREDLVSLKERLRLGLNYANIGIWDWNISTGQLVWTERIAPLFGYPAGELETTFDNFLNAIYPEDRQAVIDAVNAAIEKDEHYEIEHRVVWPDGTVRWLLERGAVVRDADGTALQMLGTVQDIDAHKRAELALVAAREEAERANLAKSEFLSQMSHELRTPMNSVLGFAQLMQYSGDLSSEHAASVHEIIRAGEHLLQLINQVLDLSRVESGNVALSIESVALCPVVEECVAMVASIASRRGIEIDHSACSGAYIHADRVRLKQVVLNLLSNAVKYNRELGRVSVDVQIPEDGERARIFISDTGPGISREQIERLFEPFDRLDADASDIEGTGIGLTLTRRLVEMMGGTIGVHSEPGKGSSFWIELPLDHVSSADACNQDGCDTADKRTTPSHVAAQNTVLYIDDNPANIRLVNGILSQMLDVALLTAHSAELGIELAMSRHPDVILLDINMPNIDGHETLRLLRADEHLATIPVIAISAYALHSDIGRSNAAGFTEYLTKPLQVDALLSILARYLK